MTDTSDYDKYDFSGPSLISGEAGKKLLDFLADSDSAPIFHRAPSQGIKSSRLFVTLTGNTGIGKSEAAKAFVGSSVVSLEKREQWLKDFLGHPEGYSEAPPVKTDFSSVTRDLVNEGVTNLPSRLVEQLETDAREFRERIVREGGIVRDTSQPRQYTLETPDNMMAALRLVCGR